MPKKRKGPWLRKSDLNWYTTHDNRVIRLGSAGDSPEIIQRKYLALHARGLTVAALTEKFLAAQLIENSRATHDWYAKFLRRFVAYRGDALFSDLTPAVVHQWINAYYGSHAASTQHAAARTVVRAINWAVDERLIDRSPLGKFRKPRPGRRETMLTLADYAACLREANPSLKIVVKFLHHTGCRPQELRVIEGRYLRGSRIVLPVADSKGRSKNRTIYLAGPSQRIIIRLASEHKTGKLFRNSDIAPWTKNSLVLAFRRLREKTGILGLCAYSFRHAYITRLLEKGVDVATVAALSGNSARMVLDVYNHVATNDERLTSVVAGLSQAE